MALVCGLVCRAISVSPNHLKHEADYLAKLEISVENYFNQALSSEDKSYFSRIKKLIKKYQGMNSQAITVGMNNLEKIERLIKQQ